MMRAGKLKLLRHGALFALALLFLSANAAAGKHLAHAGPARLITFAHEMRRDLSRAEREGLKTSVAIGSGETVSYPLHEATAITRPREIVPNGYRVSHSLTQLQSNTSPLDFSPVLNL
jgi:hypothetical protein